jgi:phage gp36-like protein
MTYATRQDLEKHYGVDEVEQRESALPAGAVDGALADADALIDGYLAGRYSLPLSAIPANLPQTAAALARYTLLGEAATDRARNDYKDAIAWLKDVQAGRVLLQSAASEPGNGPEAIVLMSTSAAVFKRSGRP